MKKLLLASALLALCVIAHSQIQFNIAHKLWNEHAMNNFQQTTDGGYILCADEIAGLDTVTNVQKGYLIKMNALGMTQWVKSFPKTTPPIAKVMDGNSVFQTNDGGYIIGTVKYLDNPSTYGGRASICFIKTDGSGNLLWSKTYPGLGNSTCYCIKQTSDLGYIACGSTNDTLAHVKYVYVMKTDNSGNLQWGKTYLESASGQNDAAYCVNPTADGGYIVTGASASGTFLMKTDNAGAITWTTNFGTAGIDCLYSVKEISGGGYIAAGTGPKAQGITLALVKFDQAGAVQWEKTYWRPGVFNGGSFDVIEVTGGYVVLNLYRFTDIGMMKTDISGNVLWAMKYTDDYCNRATVLTQTTDGGFAFSGSYYNDNYYMGVQVKKTDSLGRVGCRDSLITLNDTIVTRALLGGFIAGNATASAPDATTFTNVTLPDTLLCPTMESVPSLFSEKIISVFPNPSSGNATVHFSALNENNIEFKVYDVFGKLLLQKNEKNISGEWNETLDLTSFANGIYFIAVNMDENLIVVKKVIKE